MKYPWYLLPLCFLMTSCFDYAVNVAFEPDGSCTVETHLDMLEPIYQEAVRTLPALSENPLPLEEAAYRDWVQGRGGRLDSYQRVVSEGRIQMNFKIWYPNYAAFHSDDMFGETQLQLQGDRWVWVWDPGPMVRSLADLDEPNLEQQLSQLKPLLQGLHFSMQLSAPQVVETNLDQKDNAVRFHYDYASLLGKKTGKDQLSAFRALLVEKRVVFTTPKATTSK